MDTAGQCGNKTSKKEMSHKNSLIFLLTLFASGFSICQAAINDTLSPGLTDLSSNKSDFTCIDRALGAYYPDYESKCRKFHLCATGEDGEVLNLSFLCPEGAAFDDRATDCLPAAIVQCDQINSQLRPTRKILKENLQDDGAEFNTSFKCNGKQLGRYYADPETDCRLFHLCASGSANKSELLDFQFLCLAGTLFDDELQNCLEDGQVTGCNHGHDSRSRSMRVKRNTEPLRVERLWKVKAITAKPAPRTTIKKRMERAPIEAPSYDMDNLPETSFSCVDKVQGGYYADVEAGCQMYHVCMGSDIHYKFLCINGSVFSQKTRTCQTWYTVDCERTLEYYALNDELPRVVEAEAPMAIDGQQVVIEDNRDFLPSHRTTGGDEQQEAQRFEDEIFGGSPPMTISTPPPPQIEIQETTMRSPNFHAFFNEMPQTSSPTVIKQRGRKRVRGRRKRIRNENHIQNIDFQSASAVTEGTTPDVLLVDQGVSGYQSRIPELLEELHVRGRFAENPQHEQQQFQQQQIRIQEPQQQVHEPTSIQQQQVQEQPSQQQLQQRQQIEQLAVAEPSGDPFFEFFESMIEEGDRSRQQFRDSQIEQGRHQNEVGVQQTRRRRPSTTTTTTTERSFIQIENIPRTSALIPTSWTQDLTTPTSQIGASLILPELHEIPLFDTTVPTSRITPTNLHRRQRPVSNVNLETILLQQLSPTTNQLSRTEQSLWNHFDINSLASSRNVGSNIPIVHHNQDQDLVLQRLPTNTRHHQPTTVSNVLLLVPPSSQTSPSTSHQFDFRLRHQRTVSPEKISDTTPASQFLEYDSARLTAGGPSSIPPTSFTCTGKVMGGYYADLPTKCKMFHICSTGWQRSVIYDYRFLCGNETFFDQRSLTCTTADKLDCQSSEANYPKRPLPEEINAEIRVPNAELHRVRVVRAVQNVEPVKLTDVPATGFSCQGRENGRFYADASTNCKLFHLCTDPSGNPSGGFLQEHSFSCPNNTVFDQRSQACDDQTDALNCSDDPPHYGIDEEFGRVQ